MKALLGSSLRVISSLEKNSSLDGACTGAVTILLRKHSVLWVWLKLATSSLAGLQSWLKVTDATQRHKVTVQINSCILEAPPLVKCTSLWWEWIEGIAMRSKAGRRGRSALKQKEKRPSPLRLRSSPPQKVTVWHAQIPSHKYGFIDSDAIGWNDLRVPGKTRRSTKASAGGRLWSQTCVTRRGVHISGAAFTAS